MDDKLVKRWILLILVAILFILGFLVLKEIILAIVLALLFAYILYPLYPIIHKVVKNKVVSVLLLLFILFIVIAVPLIFLSPSLIKQSLSAYNNIQELNFSDAIKNLFPSLIDDQVATAIAININNILGKFFINVISSTTNFIINLPSFLLQFTVFLFVLYYAIKDADLLKKYFASISPFSEALRVKIMSDFRNITNAIVYGQVLIGIIQGIALGIGLFFLGIPNVIIITIIAAIVSIIPVIGPWIVWFPIGILLVLSGQTGKGIILLLYGALFVSLIDNFLRPLLLSKRAKMPVPVSVVGIIGGLYYFGLIGLILGPLILAYILILLEFYKQGKLSELI